jgi:hypothetical protein
MNTRNGSWLVLALLFLTADLQAQRPVLSLGDSSLNLYLGGKLKTTMLLSSRRPFPTSGTAYFLLPKDATGEESSFDLNARASSLFLKLDGPRLGDFRFGGMVFIYFTASITSENYGILPSLLYGDLKNDKWRFAVGQQMDVFAERVPDMVDGFFAMAASGCAGNSSRGQLRAERFIPVGKGKLTVTAALSEPITTYISSNFKSNTADAGLPNVEAALRYRSLSGNHLLPYDALELGISAVTGRYRVFKNDGVGGNIRVNKPHVWGVAAEYAFHVVPDRFGIQGEAYLGQALGNYCGTILQTTKGEFDKEIHSRGFWVEGAMVWGKALQSRFGYGQDRNYPTDIGAAGLQMNQTVFANLMWDLNKSVQVSVEPTWRKTTYLGLRSNNGPGIMFAAQ